MVYKQRHTLAFGVLDMKELGYWTRKDFEALPFRKSWAIPVECSSLVVIPAALPTLWMKVVGYWKNLTKQPHDILNLHDSGYLCMDFAAVGKDGVPFCLLSGCSDVVHFDGIGGFGYDWLNAHGTVPTYVLPSGWCMDCLPVSGFLRIFARAGVMALAVQDPHLPIDKILSESPLSSFEIYALPSEQIKVKPMGEILPPSTD